jgi:anti-sigma B factor antagonist
MAAPVKRPLGELTVHVESYGDERVAVTAVGELDITTAHRLRAELERVTATRPESVVLDLTGIGFMDSVALAAIVRASRLLGDPDRLLIVVGTDSYARLVLDATGLSRCLNVVTAREDA